LADPALVGAFAAGPITRRLGVGRRSAATGAQRLTGLLIRWRMGRSP
jgi:hypothetical protein